MTAREVCVIGHEGLTAKGKFPGDPLCPGLCVNLHPTPLDGGADRGLSLGKAYAETAKPRAPRAPSRRCSAYAHRALPQETASLWRAYMCRPLGLAILSRPSPVRPSIGAPPRRITLAAGSGRLTWSSEP